MREVLDVVAGSYIICEFSLFSHYWFILIFNFSFMNIMQQPNVCRCAMSGSVGCHCYTPSIQQ